MILGNFANEGGGTGGLPVTFPQSFCYVAKCISTERNQDLDWRGKKTCI